MNEWLFSPQYCLLDHDEVIVSLWQQTTNNKEKKKNKVERCPVRLLAEIESNIGALSLQSHSVIKGMYAHVYLSVSVTLCNISMVCIFQNQRNFFHGDK